MIIHQCDQSGAYLFDDNARESPLEKGAYLMPAWSTTVKKPEDKEGFDWFFNFETKEWYEVEWPEERRPKTAEELQKIKLEEARLETEATKVRQLEEATFRVKTLINSSSWLLERHAEQKVLGVKASLTEEQYTKVLEWRQALRDLSKTDRWPVVAWPSLNVPGFKWPETNQGE